MFRKTSHWSFTAQCDNEILCNYQCNALLPQVWAEGGEMLGAYMDHLMDADLCTVSNYTVTDHACGWVTSGHQLGRIVSHCQTIFFFCVCVGKGLVKKEKKQLPMQDHSWSLHCQYLPSTWGIIIFRDANPHGYPIPTFCMLSPYLHIFSWLSIVGFTRPLVYGQQYFISRPDY